MRHFHSVKGNCWTISRQHLSTDGMSASSLKGNEGGTPQHPFYQLTLTQAIIIPIIITIIIVIIYWLPDKSQWIGLVSCTVDSESQTVFSIICLLFWSLFSFLLASFTLPSCGRESCCRSRLTSALLASQWKVLSFL